MACPNGSSTLHILRWLSFPSWSVLPRLQVELGVVCAAGCALEVEVRADTSDAPPPTALGSACGSAGNVGTEARMIVSLFLVAFCNIQ